jgi:ubiquinone/menaquinone biosynthesis C-methylase UbiE
MFSQNTQASFQSLEEEYTPKYCLELETAYGEGMMSEGGGQAVDSMFKELLSVLPNKKALDIGSGLGGVPFYLAKKYKMDVTGLEVNPWMVEESSRRISEEFKNTVRFALSTSNRHWPFDSQSFDIVYSKGVLVQIEDKKDLLQESYRLLKKGGYLVITDWLSSDEKKWGPHIAKLVELEKLTLYPENVASYKTILEKNGFQTLSIREDTDDYIRYNKNIIERLRTQLSKQSTDSSFDIAAAIEGYEAIVEAFETGELHTIRFLVQKPEA